jgi:hypothetical protein
VAARKKADASGEPIYRGILPLVTYNYVVPTATGELTAAVASSYMWSLLWRPGYALYKYRMEQPGGEWDWAVIELGGIFHSMYDFCGGGLVSSLRYNVCAPNIRRPSSGWDGGDNRHFRAGGVPMPQIVVDRGDAEEQLLDISRNVNLSPAAIATGAAREWMNSIACFKRFEPYIPDAGPFLGPGLTLEQLRVAARNSTFAWVWSMANSQASSGVFAADRTTVNSVTRDCLKLGSVSTFRRYSSNPSVSFSMDTRGGSPTAGTHVRAWGFSRETGLEMMRFRHKARFHPGQSYSNRNSGHRVSMSTVVMPSYDSGVREDNSTFHPVPPEEARKLRSPNYVRLFPNYPLHNS